MYFLPVVYCNVQHVMSLNQSSTIMPVNYPNEISTYHHNRSIHFTFHICLLCIRDKILILKYKTHTLPMLKELLEEINCKIQHK